MPAYVITPKRAYTVLNLGWLLRHAKYVYAVHLRPVPAGTPQHQEDYRAELTAYLTLPCPIHGASPQLGLSLCPRNAIGQPVCQAGPQRTTFTCFFVSYQVAADWIQRSALAHTLRKLYTSSTRYPTVTIPPAQRTLTPQQRAALAHTMP